MPSKKEIFKLVTETAARSPAKRRKVGAVLLRDSDGHVIARGWNHHPTGGDCEDDCGNTKPEVVHAEKAVLAQVQFEGRSAITCTLYVSHEPCIDCRTAIEAAGLKYEVVEEFLKFDGDKLRYDLIPPSALESLAAVLTFGARKYKPNNWKNCEEPERYLASAMRHMEAFRRGEELDKDSGLPHLSHALTNLAFMLELGYVPKDWK